MALSKWRGSSNAQTLVLGWMSNRAATRSEQAPAAATEGESNSKQGLAERFNARSAAFMGELLRDGRAQMVQGAALRWG